MPTLTIEPSVTTVLAPKLRTRLVKELTIYAKLDDRYREAKGARKKQGDVVEHVREESGDMSIGLEGQGLITRVCGVTRKVNYKKLIKLGCRPEWIKMATEEKPKKPYTKITLANSKDEEDDE